MALRKAVKKLHRLRKKKEKLPKWKAKWNHFNEKYLGWLENFVELLIPWLVLVLLLVLIGEYIHYINVFHWHWVDSISEFFHHHAGAVHTFDQFVVAFFCIDLYFNFFKKATFESFVKTSILDIIAVAPLGALFRVSEAGEAQLLVHVGGDTPKVARAANIGALAKAESATKTTRILSRMPRFARLVSRIPRLFRLNRLSDFWAKKR
ncbi:hypothetical protein KY338_04890 [Candidatus Woesearchaeota archaeon]|nr:hypothetical protein [Candidatus Woesearchaeota archaeon]MBW3006241.1 hypothetical protein [Candidatus Woesearchaeota archaeon]